MESRAHNARGGKDRGESSPSWGGGGGGGPGGSPSMETSAEVRAVISSTVRRGRQEGHIGGCFKTLSE